MEPVLPHRPPGWPTPTARGVTGSSSKLPPGRLRLQVSVVDGTQWDLDPNRIARKYAAPSNSRVVVPDCNNLPSSACAQRATPEGSIELDLEYVDGADRSGMDPSMLRVASPGASPSPDRHVRPATRPVRSRGLRETATLGSTRGRARGAAPRS
ncbi:MAG: hypothetical protein R3A48_29630 [Polyangiales bacterium]